MVSVTLVVEDTTARDFHNRLLYALRSWNSLSRPTGGPSIGRPAKFSHLCVQHT